MAKCMPLEKIPWPVTTESIELNGPSMHLMFWSLLIISFIYLDGN